MIGLTGNGNSNLLVYATFIASGERERVKNNLVCASPLSLLLLLLLLLCPSAAAPQRVGQEDEDFLEKRGLSRRKLRSTFFSSGEESHPAKA